MPFKEGRILPQTCSWVGMLLSSTLLRRLTAVVSLWAFEQMACGRPFCWVSFSTVAPLWGSTMHPMISGMETQRLLVSNIDSKDSKAQNWGGDAALLMSTHFSNILNSVGSWGGGSFTTDNEQLCECKYLGKFDLDNFSPSYLYLECSEPMLIHTSPLGTWGVSAEHTN